MSNAVRVVSIAAAGIARGQRAWGRIRATAEEQRTLWLEVGVALMYGKQKDNRADGQKFSEWVQEMFPGLNQDTAADAIWFATNSVVATEMPVDISHPKNIRVWFNDQQATASLPEDAPKVTVEASPKFETQRDAEKFIKVDQRAATNGEGSETAARMAQAIAKKHGTTVEALRKEAAQVAPDMAHRFNPSLQLAIDGMRSTLRASAASMEASGISKDAIRDIFVQFANSL